MSVSIVSPSMTISRVPLRLSASAKIAGCGLPSCSNVIPQLWGVALAQGGFDYERDAAARHAEADIAGIYDVRVGER